MGSPLAARTVLTVLTAFSFAAPSLAAPPGACPVVPADVTGDGAVTVVDVQCLLTIALAILDDPDAPLPPCAASGPCTADADCSGALNVVDVMLAVSIALGNSAPAALDANGDACPDNCAVNAPGDPCLGCAWSAPAACQTWSWDGEACNATQPLDCEDCNACTVTACADGPACGFAPAPAGEPCPHLDPCVQTAACNGLGLCLPTAVIPGCGVAKPPRLCSLAGKQGNTIDCALSLATLPASTPLAGLQFTVSFDATSATLQDLYHTLCFDGLGCIEFGINGPAPQPLDSGHGVSTAPPLPDQWLAKACSESQPCPPGNSQCASGLCLGTGGYLGVVVTNLTNPAAPLSNATVQSFGDLYCAPQGQGVPNIVGDPELFRFRFKLLRDIPEAQSVDVSLGQLQPPTAAGFELIDLPTGLLIIQ
jgi:hypothetical protein